MQLFRAELRAATGDGTHCTLCTLVTNADQAAMRSFLREHGSDARVLEPIYAAWGFCAWHTWSMAFMEDRERGGPLVMGLLADDLLRHLASVVEASTASPLPCPPYPGQRCRMCRTMKETERYWIDWIAEALVLEPGATDLSHQSQQPRVCWPHLARLTARVEQKERTRSRWWQRHLVRHRLSTGQEQKRSAALSQLLLSVPVLSDISVAADRERLVAWDVGTRSLSPAFVQGDTALAPMRVSEDPWPDGMTTCNACQAEIAAVDSAACALFSLVGDTALESMLLKHSICPGHRWLLADLASDRRSSHSTADNSKRTSGRAHDVVESMERTDMPVDSCWMCAICRAADVEALRAYRGQGISDMAPNVMLCLAHWRDAEVLHRDAGCEDERVRIRQGQSDCLGRVREHLTEYLRSFSVSTRDPDAPSPGPQACFDALTFLAGAPPCGQRRSLGGA